MTTVRLPMPFAVNGLKNPIDITNVDGSVSFDEGYTDDYSRELGVDALAKPVERDKLNYILNLISVNTLDWQNFAYPQWTANTPYTQNAFVRWSASAGQPEGVYRALQAVPANTAPSNATYWEVQNTQISITNQIPMTYIGGVAAARDFNGISTGFYIFDNATVLDACTNKPPISDRPGYLECCRRLNSTVAMQRFTNVDGVLMIRGMISSGWTPWVTVTPSAVRPMTNFGFLQDTQSLDTLWALGPGTWGRQGDPLPNMAYPELIPGVLNQDGYYNTNSANSQSQTYISGSGVVWIRRRRGVSSSAWERQVKPSDLSAYVTAAGGTQAAPESVGGYKVFANLLRASSDMNVAGSITGNWGGSGSVAAFKIGNDAELWDINVPNTAAIRGATSATAGVLQFGSVGGSITFGTHTSDNNFAQVGIGNGIVYKANVALPDYSISYYSAINARWYRKNGGQFQWYRSPTGEPGGSPEVQLMALSDDGSLTIAGGMAAATFNSLSSKLLKDDRGPIKDALDIVMRLNPRVATLKEWYQPDDRRERYTLFAEEVRDAGATGMFVEKVRNIEGVDYCGLDYDNGVPLLIAAMQEQQQTIRELTEIVISQEARLRKLEGK